MGQRDGRFFEDRKNLCPLDCGDGSAAIGGGCRSGRSSRRYTGLGRGPGPSSSHSTRAPLSMPVTMQVFPSPAPNVYGSPISWAAYRDNALTGIENGIPAIGDPDLTPTAYYRVTTLDDRGQHRHHLSELEGVREPRYRLRASLCQRRGQPHHLRSPRYG